MAKRSSRRDFLKGRAAADAVVETLHGAVPTPNPLLLPRKEHHICVARAAMACEFEIRLNPRRFRNGMEVALEALDLVTDLEARWSFFRPDSEIGRINTLAGRGPVAVSADLWEVLVLSQRISAETGGAFDITSAPLFEVWGFSRREGRMPDEATLAEALGRVGPELIELDPTARTIRFRKPGVKINLGSIGKGWAVDRLGECLQRAGVDAFLVHGGNSSVLARCPEPGESARRTSWEIGIGDPLRKGVRIGTIQLEDVALATSGSAHQFFMHGGRRLGHVIDPRSGRPTDKVLSVTVFAPTAAEADALATAFFVLGPDEGESFCGSREEVGMIFVLPNLRGGALEMRKFGRLPECTETAT